MHGVHCYYCHTDIIICVPQTHKSTGHLTLMQIAVTLVLGYLSPQQTNAADLPTTACLEALCIQRVRELSVYFCIHAMQCA